MLCLCIVLLFKFQVVFDRLKGMALILYNNSDFAQAAVRETKGWKIGGNKIKVRISPIFRSCLVMIL